MGLLVINNVDIVTSSLLAGGSKAIGLALKLWGIYAIWLGILKIVEDTGLDKKLSKLFFLRSTFTIFAVTNIQQTAHVACKH